jgi:transcriptional regulator with XRE-family HTH domain
MASRKGDGSRRKGAGKTSTPKGNQSEEGRAADSDKDSTQEIRLAELHFEAFTTQRKRIFRANFRKLLALTGFTVEQLADLSGVAPAALDHWQRQGISYDKTGDLEAVAKAVGLENAESMFDPKLAASAFTARSRPATAEPAGEAMPIRRETAQHPVIEDAKKRRPELFTRFNERDWKEIHSLRSATGEISLSSVFRAAGRINRNRDLRHKFEVLLESEHRQTLEQLIDLMFDATTA